RDSAGVAVAPLSSPSFRVHTLGSAWGDSPFASITLHRSGPFFTTFLRLEIQEKNVRGWPAIWPRETPPCPGTVIPLAHPLVHRQCPCSRSMDSSLVQLPVLF